MRDRSNSDIREALRAARITQWQLAEELGVNEFVFSRQLRHELSPERKAEVFGAIERVAAGQGVV